MNELTMTVTGWVATDPKLIVGKGDLAVVSFRLASTPRFFDRQRSMWVDGTTEWFTVRAFRGAAYTISRSFRTGQPVVVAGRLRTSTWEAKDGVRTDHILDVTAVGHDCTRGVASFTRATGDASLSEANSSAAAAAIAASRESDEAPPEDPFDAEPALAEDPFADAPGAALAAADGDEGFVGDGEEALAGAGAGAVA